MIAGGLQRLDEQDRSRWRTGCENRLTLASIGKICWDPGIDERYTLTPEAK